MAQPETRLVKINDLKKGMTIISFMAFDKRFQTMTQRTCDWVKLNFKGCSCIVRRDEKKITLPVGQIETGDSLIRLFKLPATLKKLTIVSDQLTEALKSRGFLAFQVLPVQSSQKQNRRKEQLNRTEAFFRSVDDSKQIRDEAAKAVEELMDNTRNGDINILAVMNYVDSITEDASTVAMSAIAALKQSDKTYAHCVDVGAIFQTAYARIIDKKGTKSRFKDEHETLMGAFMHDFGKSRIPKEIIDSNEKFDPDGKEMTLIRQHPDFGAELLTKMRMPAYIVNLARYHHIKMDMSLQSSYPKIDSFDQLSMENRLLTIVDTYQALVGRRDYRKSWAPPAAVSYMEQLAGVEYDVDVWDDFIAAMGRYPVGSLVELNDRSLAFVTSVPESEPERPQVVVVRTAKGEELSHNDFIDLQEVKELSIKKGLDNYEIFGEKSLDTFLNLKVV